MRTRPSNAGTPHFPDLSGKILLIESMSAPFSAEERNLRQLQLMGVFEQLSGLIIGKPEMPDDQGAPFGYDDLIIEIVGNREYPIISNFDCGHTLPLINLSQGSLIKLDAKKEYDVNIEILEEMITMVIPPRK